MRDKNSKLLDLLLDSDDKKYSKKDLIIKFKQIFLFNTNENNAKTNSWDWVKNIRERLKTNTSDYPWKDSLEAQWKTISKHHQWDKENGWYSHKVKDQHIPADIIRMRELEEDGCPVQHFLKMMENGFYPPPEVLLTIADSFKIYFTGEGDISLEEAFFGDITKGVGNYAARANRGEDYSRFHRSYLGYGKSHDNKLSLTKFAEKYFNGEYFNEVFGHLDLEKFGYLSGYYDQEKDIDSYLRGYRRWRKALKEGRNTDN
jgi:hypothetical protein